MKLKRIMAMVLCVAMVLSTMGTVAFAEEPDGGESAPAGPVEVSTYEELVDELAEENANIILGDDITIDTRITAPDGVVIDLNGKTLYVNVENSYYNNVTIKNGNIVVGKDDANVCDGYFLVNADKTLVLDNVNMSSADDGIKGYAVFHLKSGANLDLLDSKLDIRDNEYSAGYIVYANESTAFVDVIGTTVYGNNVNGIVHATTVIDDSTFTIEDAVEHGINRSAVTIEDSEVTISGGAGRGITAQHGDLVISGNSIVNISKMGEATIELRNDKSLTIDADASVTVDAAVNNTTSGTITGNVTVELDPAAIGGSGTESDPYVIASVEALETFRASVNSGETKYSAPGVYVTLGGDIDMAGINWTPIGSANVDHGFMGNFDGKNFKIKNLTITDPALDSDGYAYAGLFGITEGTDKDNQNIIKNLTIENVNITTDGHIVAAAIAYPYYTIVDNVTVCGDIAINGGNYTAGILGYTRRCVNASNLTIDGEEGSYITGAQVVGGVISDIQMNGGLIADYSKFNAEGLTITGDINVGGISGIISGQTLDTCSVKNVSINCNDNRKGIVAGSLGSVSTISNITTENVTGANAIIGGNYDQGAAVEAKIGDTYYATLAKAAEAAEEGDTILVYSNLAALATIVNGGNNLKGITIKLANDIDLNNVDWTPIGDTVYNDKYAPAEPSKAFSGTFDGNGKVISNLKIEKITNEGPDGISNTGLFGIIGEGAVIKNLTITNVDINTDGRNVGALAGVAYKATIDNITVNGDIKISGGNNTCGVCAMTRHYDASVTNITVSGNDGSYIKGNNIVAGVLAEIAPNGSTQTFENLSVENVAITGVGGVGGIVGLVTNGALSDVSVKDVALVGRTDYQGNAMGRIRLGAIAGLIGGTTATISDVDVENVTAKNLEGTDVVLPVIGANFDAISNATEAKIGDTYYVTLAKAAKAAKSGDVIVLLCDVADAVVIPDGVTLDKNGFKADNVTGTIAPVAMIGSNGFDTLEKAIIAAQADETITLVSNVKENVTINKNITLDGANFNYTGTMTVNAAINATIQNVNFVNGGIDKATKSTTGNYTIKNCTFDGKDAFNYPLRFKGAASITVEDCAVKDYKYSFLYVTSGTNSVSVKNVTVENCPNYAVYFASGVNSATIENMTVKNSNNGFIINNTANRALTIKDCKMENVGTAIIHTDGTNTITCTVLGANDFGTAASDEYAKYVLADGAELAAASGFDVTTNVEGNFVKYADGKYKSVKAIAKIGDVIYDSFDEAIAAGGNIVLLADIALDKSIAIKKDTTLDLNGKTITGKDNNTKGNFYLFNNTSNFTITGEGAITLEAANDRAWGASSVVVANNPGGKLVIEGGKLEHLGGTAMAYAVDNLTNGKGTYAETIINGGTIKSTYRAVRQFLNGVEADNILTVNGGTIEGTNKAIWMQDPSKNANSGEITVGEGAIVKGDIYLTVTEGSTAWPVKVSIAKSAVNGDVLTSNIPDSYTLSLTDGYYGVSETRSIIVSVVDPQIDSEGNYVVKAGEEVKLNITLNGNNLINATWKLAYDNTKFALQELADDNLIFEEIYREGTQPFANGEVVATYTFKALAQTDVTSGDFIISETYAYTYPESLDATKIPATNNGFVTVTIDLIDYQVALKVDGNEVAPQGESTFKWTGAPHTFEVTTIPQATVSYKVNGEDVTNVSVDKYGTYNIEYVVSHEKGYAPVSGTYTIVVEDPEFVVEVDTELGLAHDYVDGKKLVLVYTNIDGAFFKYNGEMMLDVSTEDGETAAQQKKYLYNNTTPYKYVYAFVTDAINGDLDAYKANIKVVYADAGLRNLLRYDYDLNFDTEEDIRDVSTAFAVYNVLPYAFGNVKYQRQILISDVNRNKCVDGYDTTNVVANVITATK